MNTDKDAAPTCPIERSLAVLGDAWTILILRDANVGVTRFDQFKKRLGIAPTILTKRLATLTQEGLLDRKVYSERPPRDEYVLTDAGRDSLPVLLMIAAWGKKHRGGGPMTQFLDAETDTEIQPTAIDAVTGAALGTRALRVRVPQ